MPIFEYKCDKCSEEFEKLVMGSNTEIECLKCGSKKATKKFSLFGMTGGEKPASSSGGAGCSSCSSSSCSSCH